MLRMRRLISIVAFSLVLAVPLWAQRGGHGGGGGGHVGGGGIHSGGFSGHGGGFAGHIGGYSGTHVGGIHSYGGPHSSGVRSGPGFSRGFNHSFNRGSTGSGFRGREFRDRDSRHRGSRGRHRDFDNFVLRNNCYGYGCWNSGYSYPWWGWGGYDPWLWSNWEDEDRRFDEDYYRQYALADQWNQQNLAEQRMLRQEDEDGDQDAYAPRSSGRRYAPASASEPQDPTPATVLVFRDRHQEEVSNYAIVGRTLWSYSGQKTKKIPLADLDVIATAKANDDRGVAFHLPSTSEGQ